MKKLALLTMLFYGFLRPSVNAQTSILIYQNNFETPRAGVTPVETANEAYNDLDSRPVDDIFGGTGQGTSASVFFKQPSNLTVETLLINGPDNVYNDPTGRGGNYSIGMLAAIENDKLAIKLNATRPAGGTFPFINVMFDFSSIALQQRPPVQAVFTSAAAPVMEMRIYNAPNWTSTSNVDFANPGTQIGSARTVTGGIRTSNYTFNWTSVVAGFSLANTLPSYNGKVIVIFDLLPNNNNNLYATFDNIRITADEVSLPVNFGVVNAFSANGKLTVNWETLMEENNSHFEVQSSKNGSEFHTIGTVKSKAPGGNVNAKIDYTFSTHLGNMGIAAVSLLGFLVGGNLFRRNRWLAGFILISSLSAITFACNKSTGEAIDVKDSKLFIRVMQVDIDGNKSFSKTVQVINK